MQKNQLIKSKVKLKWRQSFIYKSVFLMKKGCLQTVLFHQRWCKDIYHIKLLIWPGEERQVRVEERRNIES